MIQNLKLKKMLKKESNNTNNFNNYNENSGFHKRLEGLGSKIIFYQDLRELRYISNMAELSFTSISGLESHTIALKER